MPVRDWTIQSTLDLTRGLWIQLSEFDAGGNVNGPRTFELSVRDTLVEAVDLIERRYFEGEARPAEDVPVAASRRFRNALWPARQDREQAFFFDPQLRPAEILADSVCRQADALSLEDWTEATFERMTALFSDLSRRSLRFFRGISPAAVVRLSAEGYDAIPLRP